MTLSTIANVTSGDNKQKYLFNASSWHNMVDKRRKNNKELHVLNRKWECDGKLRCRPCEEWGQKGLGLVIEEGRRYANWPLWQTEREGQRGGGGAGGWQCKLWPLRLLAVPFIESSRWYDQLASVLCCGFSLAEVTGDIWGQIMLSLLSLAESKRV